MPDATQCVKCMTALLFPRYVLWCWLGVGDNAWLRQEGIVPYPSLECRLRRRGSALNDQSPIQPQWGWQMFAQRATQSLESNK